MRLRLPDELFSVLLDTIPTSCVRITVLSFVKNEKCISNRRDKCTWPMCLRVIGDVMTVRYDASSRQTASEG